MNKSDNHSVVLAIVTTAVAVGLAAVFCCLLVMQPYKEALIDQQTNTNQQLAELRAQVEAQEEQMEAEEDTSDAAGIEETEL